MLLTLNSRERPAVNSDIMFYRWIYPFLLLFLYIHPMDPFP
jgi:hypothetical protein